VGVVGVQFKLNGANLGAEDTTAPYSVSWDSTTASNGAYQLTAVARDAAGNTATATAVSVTVNNTAADTTPPAVLAITPLANATNVAVNTTVTVRFSEAVDPATINGSTFVLRNAAGSTVAATIGYDAASFTAILTPTAVLANSAQYTATVVGGATDPRIKDLAGNALASSGVWSFTTVAAAVNCPCSIWAASATPATAASTDANAVELGVKFQTDVGGYITGIRFYKGTTNTGTHIGNLWSSSGQLLATATFANETASGWQQVSFSTPVAVTANTTYVASYFAPVGRYALNSQYFNPNGVTNAPLRALANAAAGGNGVYRYGTTSGFPTASYLSSNYWVDVVFTTN
jgi:hypothetical protein